MPTDGVPAASAARVADDPADVRQVRGATSGAPRRRRPFWDYYPSCTTYRALNPQLKAAAKDYLKAALPEVRRQGLLPSRLQWRREPWPSYGQCLNLSYTDLSSGFVKALEAVYPDRFKDPVQFTCSDPKAYANSYLRAVIAESSVRDQRVGFDTRAARDMLRELDRTLRVEDQEFASICVLSDVNFDDVDGQEVGGLTLSGRGDRVHFVSRVLPEALWADDHGYPLPGETAQGLAVRRVRGKGDAWWVTGSIAQSMERFLYALRLGTGATVQMRKVWSGETSMIHVNLPSPREPEDSLGSIDSFWRRQITLKPEHLPGLNRLMAVIQAMEPDGRGEKPNPIPPVLLAIWRHSRSTRVTASWQDVVLDLATALEACLGQGVKEEISLCLRTRAAHLLAFDDSVQADDVYTDVEDLYNLRSDVIHGRTKLRWDLQSLWKARGYSHVMPQDSLHVLFDRWREIVRRSITIRLALADDSLGDPLWPLIGQPTKVDKLLIRRDTREQWRERIEAVSASFGLPCLTEPAPLLWDYLHQKQGPPSNHPDGADG